MVSCFFPKLSSEFGSRHPMVYIAWSCFCRPTPPQSIRQKQQQQEQNGVKKLVAILTALNAGKLLLHDQLSALLRFSVKSELLREDTGADGLPGSGPMNIQGRKVLSELRNVIRATLQFGMEKNGMAL